MAQAKSLSLRAIAAIVAAALVVAVAAFAIGRLSAPVSSTPSSTSAEAGFARDMQTHHDQAVDMALTVRDATDNPQIRLLAFDIATAQNNQSGQMAGWLDVWGLPQASPEPSMTWMSRPALSGAESEHGSHDAAHTPGDPMPGLATSEQMQELKSLEGVEAEKLFLELMIEHHKGGVEMAEAVLDRSRERVVVTLAKNVVKSQSGEIELMEGLLGARQ